MKMQSSIKRKRKHFEGEGIQYPVNKPQEVNAGSFHTPLSITPANVWQNWFKGGQFEKEMSSDDYVSWQEPEVVLRLEDSTKGSVDDELYICHHCSYESYDFKELKSHIKEFHVLNLTHFNENIAQNVSATSNDHFLNETREAVSITNLPGIYCKSDLTLLNVDTTQHLEMFVEKECCETHEIENVGPQYIETTTHSLSPLVGITKSNENIKKKMFVECPHCDFSCAKSKTLNKHITIKHKDIKPYECTFCQFSSFYPKVLKRHIRSKHPFIKPYLCTQCLYSSFEESELKIHMINEHTNKLLHNCLYCGYVSSQCSALMAHIKGKHPLKDCSQCPHCNKKSFDSLYPEELKIIENNNLTSPILSNSRNTLPKPNKVPSKIHQCPECEYNTPQLAHLKRHVISNHTFERPYLCLHCTYTTARSDHLRKHVINKHAKNTTFHCSHCSFTSIHATDLKLHIKQAHADNNNATISFDCYVDTLCNPVDKSFKCSECAYVSKRQDNLRRHHNAQHLNEKFYQCSFCFFRTYSIDKLKDHTFARHANEFTYVPQSETETVSEEMSNSFVGHTI